MKKIFIFIFIAIISIFTISVSKTNGSNEILTRSYDARYNQSEGLAYLNSYDNVELNISDNDTTFFATKSISSLNNVELLSLSSIDINDYFVSFEATYVQDINIFFIKAKLNNSTMMIDQINLLGYPFFNDVLNVLGYNSLDVTYLSYDSFNSRRLGYEYFILTTFNKVPNYANPSTLSAHTYFVKRDYINQTSLTSYNDFPSNTTNFYSMFSTYTDRNDQFISGTTIKG